MRSILLLVGTIVGVFTCQATCAEAADLPKQYSTHRLPGKGPPLRLPPLGYPPLDNPGPGSDLIVDVKSGRWSQLSCTDRMSFGNYDEIRILNGTSGLVFSIIKSGAVVHTYTPGLTVSCTITFAFVGTIDNNPSYVGNIKHPIITNQYYCNNNSGYICNSTFPAKNQCYWSGATNLSPFFGTAYTYVPRSHKDWQVLYYTPWVDPTTGTAVDALAHDGGGELAIVSTDGSVNTNAPYSTWGAPCH